jgi:hypothetical protein
MPDIFGNSNVSCLSTTPDETPKEASNFIVEPIYASIRVACGLYYVVGDPPGATMQDMRADPGILGQFRRQDQLLQVNICA